MPQIIPIKDLKNTSEISDLCHSTSEPVYVTKGTTDNDGIVCKPDAGELIEKKEIPQNVVEVSSGLLSKKLLELAKAVAVCETENSHVREAISERDREIICVVVDKRIQ